MKTKFILEYGSRMKDHNGWKGMPVCIRSSKPRGHVIIYTQEIRKTESEAGL